ncbi:MAG: putative lipid II flippase FtsW, partial [Gammaproteobacteria bacterium]|nr:putative lipid II flippase FtsW [Gammaproteobacteria bacterium]
MSTMASQAIQGPVALPVEPLWFDKTLVTLTLALMAIGLIMVSSASVPYADSEYYDHNRFHFIIRHSMYLLIALIAALATLNIKISHWEKLGPYLLICGIMLLMLVIFIGREVNGSKRWLDLGLFTIQVSEPVKIFVVSYLAGYLVRRREELHTQIKGFVRPLIVLGLVTGFLLLEPDFGASAVIVITCLTMMFLAGAKLWQFIVLSLMTGCLLTLIATTTTYRLQRLQSFLDPWQDPFGTGYQLTQSLIAFGRGEFWGMGLGNSIQKLAYLPEAHTDFVFAVLAEEMGFLGVLVVLILYVLLLNRIMNIGRRAVEAGSYFAGYMAWGLGITLTLQAVINIGVNCGMLPTKGLTLPLISYGGSSLIVSSVV